ncbi:MAG: RNA-directed DNA polymerase [Treponema sp.]|nr:RNA-directed DNA polymerase [Treponema sp.]
MSDTRFKKVYKIENLRLAWNRINTSTTNLFYKDYYRDLFWYYGMTLDENLKQLSERLKNHSYKYAIPLKFYKPKSSGLQRTFSLLSIEDQIVYQAFANVIVPDIVTKRRKFELNTVFSNIFSDDINSIFLFHSWRYGYKAFKNNIKINFENGNLYTAHFDLAAFFDTIDHNSLTSSIMTNINSEYCNELKKALDIWANPTEAKSKRIAHSIPQGPVASIIFSELFLISIDEKMSFNENFSYSRYVDDIVIQGKTKNDVINAIIKLERLCKAKGLVPQSSKFEIIKAENIEHAIGKRPSLSDDEKELLFGNPENVKNEFEEAFSDKKFDGSKIKYILKSYNKTDVLFQNVLDRFNDFYEYSEEFINYLSYFAESKSKELLSFFEPILLTDSIPYGFVKGEIWSLIRKISDYEAASIDLTLLAYKKLDSKIEYDEKYGIYDFLSKEHAQEYYYKIGVEDSSIFQELSLNFLSLDLLNDYYSYLAFGRFRKRSMEELKIILQNANYYTNLVNNTFFSKYIEPAKIQSLSKYETIQYLLKEDYEADSLFDWKKFFKNDYELASVLIYNAHLSIDINKTAWLNLIDSFNDLLIRTFIELLKVNCPPSTQWPKTINSQSELVDYGSILKQTSNFTNTYPQCFDLLKIHDRRSKDLLSHAKDKKTIKANTFVSAREQGNLIKIYTPALQSLITEIKNIL